MNALPPVRKGVGVSWRDASRFTLGFGEYRGKTLDQIASTDKGLLYLDWLRGETKHPFLASVLKVYLEDPTIASELKKAMESK